MLIRLDSNKYFVKADNTAIGLMDSSFAEAVEFLFMVFFVFAVDYPSVLRLFYGFLERIMKIDSSVKSSVLTDLLRKLTHMAQSQSTVTGDVPMVAGQ